MSELVKLLTVYLVFMNIASFVMYGMDKYKAKKQAWRIPENALLMSAVCGGAYGAYLGMNFFHHKTKHVYFRVINLAGVIIWTGLLIWMLFSRI